MKKLVRLLIVVISITPFLHSCGPSAYEKAEKQRVDDSIAKLKVATPQQAYLDTAIILWTLSTEELEKYLHKQVEPVEMPDKDRKSRFLVKYLSFNDVGFDSLHVYESEPVKALLYDEQVVAVVGNYFNLSQEKNSKGKESESGVNIVNLMFIGTPVKIAGTRKRSEYSF